MHNLLYIIMCLTYINESYKIEREHGVYGLAHITLQFYTAGLSNRDGEW
jgi:hypothetical protein